MDHAHSEFTQINWNGVLGEIKLVAVDPVYVDDMQVYPDIKNKKHQSQNELSATVQNIPPAAKYPSTCQERTIDYKRKYQ